MILTKTASYLILKCPGHSNKQLLYIADIPKLNAREEIEGIKVLLSSTGDPSEKDDTEATNWLKKLFKKPRPQFDKIPKNTSIFVSIFEASKNEALPVIRDMKTWRDLKDKLKEFMINYKQLSPLQVFGRKEY